MVATTLKRAGIGFLLGMIVGALIVVFMGFANGGSLVLPPKLVAATGSDAGALLARTFTLVVRTASRADLALSAIVAKDINIYNDIDSSSTPEVFSLAAGAVAAGGNALLAKAFLPEVPIRVEAACCAGVTPASHENALAAMRVCQIEVV